MMMMITIIILILLLFSLWNACIDENVARNVHFRK